MSASFLPRDGVAVWFVEASRSASPTVRSADPGGRTLAGRRAAHEALAGLLTAYGIRAERRPYGCLLCAGHHGKPGVDTAFEFSLSHTAEHAVVATSLERPVGVDLERDRSWPERPAWLERLHPRERAAVDRPDAGDTGMLECWTRHEAIGKALGCGLAHGLRILGEVAGGTFAGLGVRSRTLVPPRGAACGIAVLESYDHGRSVPLHLGRWTSDGPVVDRHEHLQEAC